MVSKSQYFQNYSGFGPKKLSVISTAFELVRAEILTRAGPVPTNDVIARAVITSAAAADFDAENMAYDAL